MKKGLGEVEKSDQENGNLVEEFEAIQELFNLIIKKFNAKHDGKVYVIADIKNRNAPEFNKLQFWFVKNNFNYDNLFE